MNFCKPISFQRNETILVHCAKGINCTHNLQKNATRFWSSTTLTFILAKMLIEEVLTASITAIYVNEKMHRDRRDSCTSSLIQIGNVHNAHKTQADVRSSRLSVVFLTRVQNGLESLDDHQSQCQQFFGFALHFSFKSFFRLRIIATAISTHIQG